MCRALAPVMQRALLPTIRSGRALPAEELRLVLVDQLPGLAVATVPSFAEAWEEARNDSAPILISGSLHFAGEVLAFLRGVPAAFEECLQ
jgi:folylpolyglutamate synthase/dihydropteroate synthase